MSFGGKPDELGELLRLLDDKLHQGRIAVARVHALQARVAELEAEAEALRGNLVAVRELLPLGREGPRTQG